MSCKVPTSNAAFIEEPRRYLSELRVALLAAARNDEDEEADIKRESADTPLTDSSSALASAAWGHGAAPASTLIADQRDVAKAPEAITRCPTALSRRRRARPAR